MDHLPVLEVLRVPVIQHPHHVLEHVGVGVGGQHCGRAGRRGRGLALASSPSEQCPTGEQPPAFLPAVLRRVHTGNSAAVATLSEWCRYAAHLAEKAGGRRGGSTCPTRPTLPHARTHARAHTHTHGTHARSGGTEQANAGLRDHR